MGKYYITHSSTDADFINSHIYYTEEQAEADHFGAGGNSIYTTYNDEMYQRLYYAFINLNNACKDILSDENSRCSSEAEVVKKLINLVQEYFEKADRSELTNSEILALWRLRDDFRNSYSDSPERRTVIQKTCEIIYGKPFISDTLIAGICREHWIYVIYPQELSDKIPFIEALIFKTGREYYISLEPLDEPPERADWYPWNIEFDMTKAYSTITRNLDKDCQAELEKGAADIIGCAVDEVEFLDYGN